MNLFSDFAQGGALEYPPSTWCDPSTSVALSPAFSMYWTNEFIDRPPSTLQASKTGNDGHCPAQRLVEC
jgi:hypothetical protein